MIDTDSVVEDSNEGSNNFEDVDLHVLDAAVLDEYADDIGGLSEEFFLSEDDAIDQHLNVGFDTSSFLLMKSEYGLVEVGWIDLVEETCMNDAQVVLMLILVTSDVDIIQDLVGQFS